MEKKIIIINGTGGAGKDSFVSFCGEFTNVLNISAVDKVKEAAKILVGWNGEKDEISRKLLSDLKKLSIQYNDAPTQYIKIMAEEFQKSDEKIMFVHIREIDEIEKAKKILDAQTLLITNPRIQLITSNDSDKKVNDYNYDYYISNDGTLDDLRTKANQFIKELSTTKTLSKSVEKKIQL